MTTFKPNEKITMTIEGETFSLTLKDWAETLTFEYINTIEDVKMQYRLLAVKHMLLSDMYTEMLCNLYFE